jgi:hypothetical protein
MRGRWSMGALWGIALATAAVACVGSSPEPPGSGSAIGSPPTPAQRPESTATLEIVSPSDGQVVDGSRVPVRLSLDGGRLVPAASTDLRPDEGHLHVVLDDGLVDMTARLRSDLADVAPGPHLLRVEYVASDHAPFDPRVIDAASFEVET